MIWKDMLVKRSVMRPRLIPDHYLFNIKPIYIYLAAWHCEKKTGTIFNLGSEYELKFEPFFAKIVSTLLEFWQTILNQIWKHNSGIN